MAQAVAHPVGRRRRSMLATVRELVGDAEEQLTMLRRISLGETIEIGKGKGKRTLVPDLADVRQACIYLIERRWGKLPTFDPISDRVDALSADGAGPSAVIPARLATQLRSIARQVGLGLLDAQTVDVTPAQADGKEHSHTPPPGLASGEQLPAGRGPSRPAEEAGGTEAAGAPARGVRGDSDNGNSAPADVSTGEVLGGDGGKEPIVLAQESDSSGSSAVDLGISGRGGEDSAPAGAGAGAAGVQAALEVAEKMRGLGMVPGLGESIEGEE